MYAPGNGPGCPTRTILTCGVRPACCLTSCQSDSSNAIVDAGWSNKIPVAPWYFVVGSEQDANGILAFGDEWFSVPTDLRHFGSPTCNADGASPPLLSQVVITPDGMFFGSGNDVRKATNGLVEPCVSEHVDVAVGPNMGGRTWSAAEFVKQVHSS